MHIVNIQRTSFGEVAKHRMDNLIDEVAEIAREGRAIYPEDLWQEWTEIGKLLMHHIVEIRASRSPNAIRRIMISPRRLFEYFFGESRRSNWMHDHREEEQRDEQ